MSGCQESPMSEDAQSARVITLTDLEKKEKWRNYHKEYCKKNKEHIAYMKKKYRDSNKEKIRESLRKWKEANKDKVKEERRKYSASHLLQKCGREHRRRARKRNAGIEIFSLITIFIRDNWVCQLCKKKVNKNLKWPNPLSPSLDHIIPLSNGGTHTIANVQLAHLICNMKAGIRGIKQTRMF